MRFEPFSQSQKLDLQTVQGFLLNMVSIKFWPFLVLEGEGEAAEIPRHDLK